MKKHLLIAFLFVQFFVLKSSLFSQSNIDESGIQQTFYVNNQHSQANDENAGTDPEKPLKSIQKAIDKVGTSLKTKIRIYPGTYRENVTVLSGDNLLIIEATEKGKAIISGSDVFKDWTNEGDVYSHNYEKNYNNMNGWFFEVWEEIKHRRELVFVNGKMLEQVYTKDEIKEGTFAVSDEDGKIWIKPFSGTDMNTALVEVGRRGGDDYGVGRNGALFIAYSHNNMVVRGLTVQHGIGIIKQQSFKITQSENILIEDCQFVWNHSIGMDLDNIKNLTVRRCKGDNNGSRGLGSTFGDMQLWEDNSATGNNWFYGWKLYGHDAAGLKMFVCKNIRINRYKGHDNLCKGLWFDWDNHNIVIENSLFEKNIDMGIDVEASQGPFLIKNCVIRNNNTTGLQIYGAKDVTVRDSYLYDNGNNEWTPQIGFGIDHRVVNEVWPLNVSGCKIINCKISAANKPNASLIRGYAYNVNHSAILQFTQSVQSESNCWYHPSNTTQFYTSDSIAYEEYRSDYRWNIPQLTFQQWQEVSGQDKNSTWSNCPLNPTDPTIVDGIITPGAGKISRRVWNNVEGNTIGSIPLNQSPSFTDELDAFEIPSAQGNNYATQLRGYVVPPVSGNYIFYISGDDHCQLLLSTDESPENAKVIASVNDWTNSREWDKLEEQESNSIYLTAGQKYYIEALHKQASGGDNLAVGWQIPGGPFEGPIEGKHLMPYNLITSSLEYQEKEENFSIFPIPASSVINISANKNSLNNEVLIIRNYQGVVVKSISLENGKMDNIDVSALSEGIYFAELKNNNTVSGKKFIINR